MQPDIQTITVDIAIIGGGVAGLWLLNRAVNAGYNAVLFEQQALGSDQTIASQGMIHGGVKYTLSGALSGASEAIADMPDYWRRCMAGEGDVDLRGTRTLSDHFYMWSSQSAASRITTFLASKALRGRVDALKQAAYPPVFQNPAFKGSLYKLVDTVIDTASLLSTLSKPHSDRIYRVDWRQAQLQRHGDGARIVMQAGETRCAIESQLMVLAAGQGNGDLLEQLQITTPAMQLRPLQQVMVRHHHPHALYAHCVGTDSKPRLTISSHADGDAMVWYLGGQLAEDGVAMQPDELIVKAKTELNGLFPWLDWDSAEWATLRVNRAEPQQPGLLRPDNAWLSVCEGLPRCVVAWPTKLTLAPNLGMLLLDHLQQQQITPQNNNVLQSNNVLQGNDVLLASMTRLQTVAPSPWQNIQWKRD